MKFVNGAFRQGKFSYYSAYDMQKRFTLTPKVKSLIKPLLRRLKMSYARESSFEPKCPPGS